MKAVAVAVDLPSETENKTSLRCEEGLPRSLLYWTLLKAIANISTEPGPVRTINEVLTVITNKVRSVVFI